MKSNLINIILMIITIIISVALIAFLVFVIYVHIKFWNVPIGEIPTWAGWIIFR